jgi:hypothetical protein
VKIIVNKEYARFRNARYIPISVSDDQGLWQSLASKKSLVPCPRFWLPPLPFEAAAEVAEWQTNQHRHQPYKGGPSKWPRQCERQLATYSVSISKGKKFTITYTFTDDNNLNANAVIPKGRNTKNDYSFPLPYAKLTLDLKQLSLL